MEEIDKTVAVYLSDPALVLDVYQDSMSHKILGRALWDHQTSSYFTKDGFMVIRTNPKPGYTRTVKINKRYIFAYEFL